MARTVVIVGAGARGAQWAREIKRSPSFKIAGLVDTDENRLKALATQLGIPSEQVFVSLERACQQLTAAAAIIATPADLHEEPCRTLLDLGIPVLVEKPFTQCLRSAVDLVSLAERKNVPLLVAQNYRYLRSFRTARRLISEEVLGPIGIVEYRYYRVPHEMANSLSRLDHNVLWGMGVHHLDALRHVLDKNVTSVLAESFTLPWGELPRGASMQVMLSLDDETRAYYSATYESSGHEFFERGQEFYARFVGAHATLHIFQRWLVLCEQGKLPRIIRRGRRAVSEEQILLQHLDRAMTTGVESECSGRGNLQTMAIVEACVRSADEKRWVKPQELLDELQ